MEGNFKFYVGVFLFLMTGIFAVQNAEVVTLKFLIWEASLSRAIMVFIVFAAGIVMGWALKGLLGGKP